MSVQPVPPPRPRLDLAELLADERLPQELREQIAAANALAIGLQPAILATLALAQEIFENNLAQQRALAAQHAAGVVQTAAVGKYAEIILKIDAGAEGASDQVLSVLRDFTAWSLSQMGKPPERTSE